MIKLRFISFFLSLVMAIQLLPVSGVGYEFSMCCNQMTEELPQGTAEDTSKGEFSLNNFIPATPHHLQFDFSRSAANFYIHSSAQIPSNHSTEVVSPPPDAV